VVYAGTETWSPLPVSLTNSLTGLVLADFNGNGRVDIGKSFFSDNRLVWMVSYDGTANWAPLRTATVALDRVPAIGRFDDLPGADVLLWSSRSLDIASSGSGANALQSRQEMR
jgi:hypothetical protein